MSLKFNVPINLPLSPELKEIDNVVNICSKLGVKSFQTKEFNQIEKLSPLQFLFICGVNAKLGYEFSYYLSIIQKYISHLSNDDLDLILNLENALYIHFIKYFETEDAYNEFFEIFTERYKSVKHVKQFNQKSGNKGILFFYSYSVFPGSHKFFI